MGVLHQLFSLLCGQAHNWTVGGEVLPFCQRCTGLYVGGMFAQLLVRVLRPRPTPLLLWAHGIAMLVMIPFGYHFVPQSAMLRTLTGFVFAFGMTYYLALVPAQRLLVAPRDVAPAPLPAGPAEIAPPARHRSNALAYFLAALAGAPLLLLAVDHGARWTALALAIFGTLGLVGYALLLAANLVMLPLAVRQLLRHGPTAS